MKKKRLLLALTLCLAVAFPKPAAADFFGGDVVVLTQILAQAIQQLLQLKALLSTGNDTLDLLKDINSGIRDGLSVIQMLDPKFNPGLYGNTTTANQVLAILSDLYGKIPATNEARLQQAQDQAASESIAMNSTLFQVADQADEQSRAIIAQSQVVNPGGAAKLTAQSVAVLIGVTTQVLRTNSMMLKMMGQNMALSNRKDKLQSEQFKTQYEGISSAIQGLPKTTTLPSLQTGK
jgi:hypothetical protein